MMDKETVITSIGLTASEIATCMIAVLIGVAEFGLIAAFLLL